MPVAGSKSEEASRIHRFASWMAGACIAAAGVWAVMAPSPADAAPVAPSCSTASLLGNVDAVDAIEASSQQGFLVKLNELRRSQGLGNLAWNGALTVHAIAWSEHMSAQNRLYHARDTGPGDGVEPHQDYVTIGSKIVPNWQRLAENVGVSGMYSSCSLTALESNAAKAVDALHRAFVNSPGHYKNMVGDHNQVGIGVHIDSDEMWVTVRFAKGDLPSGAAAQVQSVSTSAAAKYIQAAYGLFQGRTPTAGELSYWTPGVQAGDRRSITTALARSEPWAGRLIDDLYRKVLGRAADPAGKRYWLDQIARGFPIEAAAVEFYGSREYFTSRGGTNSALVRALYRDLLHRPADASGLTYWTNRLDTGRLTRSGVAYGFYRGIESRRDRVSAIHERVFGYGIGGTARDAWAERLARVGDVALAAEFAASDTYWAMATR